MYTQAHLRFCEALAVLGEAEGFWRALETVTPIAMAETVPNACLRQRNCYFTSSDAAFHDRYEASAEWDRVRAGSVGVEAGWRIYSGGPGLFVDLLISRAAGRRRRFGEDVWASLGSAAGDSIVLAINAEET
jgi:cellobiose phosphorylase